MDTDAGAAPRSSLLNGLSFMDRIFGIDGLSTHCGYVLPRRSPVEALDVAQLEAAVRRVVDKWRLIAGRVELSEAEAGQPRRYGVRVPLGPLPPSHKITTITTSTHNTPFPTPLSSTPRSLQSFDILPSPPFSHFVHPSTPLSLSALAKADAPIISFHLATFTDAFAIGFTAPHGVFDATGMGMVLKALECELSGQCEWDVPPVQVINALEESAADFLAKHPVAAEAGGWRKAVSGVAGGLRLGGHILWDKVWFGVEEKGVFIGEELMRGIIEAVKADVKKHAFNGEYISSADVVTMWFIKAAYAAEPDSPNRLALNGAFDFRPALGLHNYPHTTVGFQLLPPIALSSLPTSPLAQLALYHRRSLLAAREPDNLAPLLSSLKTRGYSNILPSDSYGTDLWIVSNQSSSERARTVNWGRLVTGREGTNGAASAGTTPADDKGRFWMWSGRRGIDHVLSLNRVEGGWFINGSIRRSRWASVEGELEKLVAAAGGVATGGTST